MTVTHDFPLVESLASELGLEVEIRTAELDPQGNDADYETVPVFMFYGSERLQDGPLGVVSASAVHGAIDFATIHGYSASNPASAAEWMYPDYAMSWLDGYKAARTVAQ